MNRRLNRLEHTVYLVGSAPSPDDRRVCIIYLSRAGLVLDGQGEPVEAEPSPASVAAQVAERYLAGRLFAHPGQSRLQVSEIASLKDGLTSWTPMGAIARHHDSIVLIAPVADGRLPDVVIRATTAPGGPVDCSGITVHPVITRADSTGDIGQALEDDLGGIFPNARIARPFALDGETAQDIAPQLEGYIDRML